MIIYRLTTERFILVSSNVAVLNVVTKVIVTNTLSAAGTSLKPRRALPRFWTNSTVLDRFTAAFCRICKCNTTTSK